MDSIGEQNVPQQLPTQVVYKKDSKLIYLLSFLLVCSLLFSSYLLFKTYKITTIDTNDDELGTPTTKPITSSDRIMSNLISYSGLNITYPSKYIPIFGKFERSVPEKIVYFTNDQNKLTSLMNCAKTDNCSDYLVSLEISSGNAVSQNYSLESFIKTYNKVVDITKLKNSTKDSYSIWQGYVDENKNTYQYVIGDKNLYGYFVLKSNNLDALNDFVQLIDKIEYSELVNFDLTKQKNTKAFLLEFDSTLQTPNNSGDITDFILPSLLSVDNKGQNYHYALYLDQELLSYPNPQNYFAGKYYLLTDNTQLQEGDYGTDQFSIKVTQPQKNNLNKYLSNTKYCEVDNDCSKRLNFCSVGAYNKYHAYLSPWGCGPAEYENLGNSLEFDEKLSCSTDLKFDSIKCINNSCVGSNPQAVCK